MGRWPALALGPPSRDKHDRILAPWAKGLRYLWVRRLWIRRRNIKFRRVRSSDTTPPQKTA
eukprot:scaffold14973_cov155-Isochrysis_galbana.AAC.4